VGLRSPGVVVKGLPKREKSGEGRRTSLEGKPRGARWEKKTVMLEKITGCSFCASFIRLESTIYWEPRGNMECRKDRFSGRKPFDMIRYHFCNCFFFCFSFLPIILVGDVSLVQYCYPPFHGYSSHLVGFLPPCRCCLTGLMFACG
jgi:hypothetical protein